VRRLDAAFAPRGGNAVLSCAVAAPKFQGGVKPPHSMALRAFSWFLGTRRPTGMSDCFEIAKSETPLARLRDRNDSIGQGSSMARVRGPTIAWARENYL